MKDDIDLDLTHPDTQLVIATKREDFFDAELEVATVHIDVLENAGERLAEYQAARILTRNRPNPNVTHPKILLDQQVIDEKALAILERVLDYRERLAGLKTRKARVQKLA